MTDLEEKLYKTLQNVHYCLTQRHVSRPMYLEMMGEIIAALKHVQYVLGGCSTGRHIKKDYCHCPKKSTDTGTKVEQTQREKE